MRSAERSRAETRRGAGRRDLRHRSAGRRGVGSGILLGAAALLLLGLLCVGPVLGTAAVLATGALTLGMVAAGWLLDRPHLSGAREGRETRTGLRPGRTLRSSVGRGPSG